MKIKQKTNLENYGFVQDKYNIWTYKIDGFSGKGKDKDKHVRIELLVYSDRELSIYVTNDHVSVGDGYESVSTDEVYDRVIFDESVSVPQVLVDLIRNDEIESDQKA